jgi:hypothetical protein
MGYNTSDSLHASYTCTILHKFGVVYKASKISTKIIHTNVVLFSLITEVAKIVRLGI